MAFSLALAPALGLAGTTGGVSGTVRDADTGKPVAGARVSLSSPSENVRVDTDANGHFSFVSLAPDTYTVSLQREGYDTASQSGITISADTQQTLSLTLRTALKTIGTVRSRSSTDLVRPGTTADVYAINARQQDVLSSLGGGGNQETAYSAISSVSGAYVPSGQNGYNQAIQIRGGDSGQVGFEFDGVPVNRGFDNYLGGSLSSLGQLELQVYTGASPASSEAQGLAGFVNQVIRSGSYPATTTLKIDIGGPAYYHNFNFETGGSNEARTFSYYAGTGGYNQDYRYIDQFDGASYGTLFGPILYSCPATAPATLPSCFTGGQQNMGAASAPGYALGPPGWAGPAATVISRSSVANVHIGIPHGNGLKDDIQLLYDNNMIQTQLQSSPQEFGNVNFINYGQPAYSDSWSYTGPLGAVVTDPAQFNPYAKVYYFPSSPQPRSFADVIPFTQRDTQYNNQAIFKLQYQKNFNTSSFLRLYGYTYYSDYIAAGPNSSYQPYTGLDSGDYSVSSHTRGVSAAYTNQLSDKHLLEADFNYTTSTSLRAYSTQPFGSGDSFAVLVNPADIANPSKFSGTCYQLPASGTAALATTCNDGSKLSVGSIGGPTFASLSGVGCAATNIGCSSAFASAPAPVSGVTCGSGPCAYYVVENGAYGPKNAVKPDFYGLSLNDTWKPNGRITVTAGVRLDQYSFTGDNTNTSAARTFWFSAINNDTCYNTQTLQLIDKTNLTPLDTSAMPATPVALGCGAFGSQYQTVNLQNTPNQKNIYSIFQPRVGATYSLGPNTVLRASWGKYNEQPSAAYQQYDSFQQNLPNLLVGFYSYGFNTPGHLIRPEVSYNSDFSLEHHFAGTDVSLKLTPFYRQTYDQIQNFYLDVKSGLISGLNVGRQTSEGLEFTLNKGDFSRNGLSGQLSFAYTNAYIKYDTLSNGSTILSPINSSISTYNSYTKACAPGGSLAGKSQYGTPLCGGTSTGVAAAPCYDTTGAADYGCAATSVANPYWNAPAKSLFDPSANYIPYSNFPGAIGTGANSFEVPYVGTLVLNYKHDKFAITPSLQFQAGNRYGSPETTPGIDPAVCPGLTTPAAGDPRYNFGAAGGVGYDSHASTCGTLTAIPDQYTGNFDAIGAFRQPSQILGNVRISYQATNRIELVGTFVNVLSHCFGGQQTSFTYFLSPQVCSYTGLANATAPVGNVYNPGDNIQTFQRYPYEPAFGPFNDNGFSNLQPFSAYLSVRLKI